MDGTMAGFIIIDLIFLYLVYGVIVQYKKGRSLRVLKKLELAAQSAGIAMDQLSTALIGYLAEEKMRRGNG